MDNFLDIKAIATDVVTYMIIAGLGILYLFINWIVKLIKKTNPDLQPTFTPEQLKIVTEQAIEKAVEKIKEATDAEKAELLEIIDKLNYRLNNLPEAFEKSQAQIAELKAKFEQEGKGIKNKKIKEVITALDRGDFSKADELLFEIEKQEYLSVELSARSAYARGELAEQELRWRDAATHYVRAAQLNPTFETLIVAQKFALTVGDFSIALSFGIQAEQMAIIEHGENSEQHAHSLNNLGGAYKKTGNYEMAEKLYNKALDICKNTFGETHTNTAATINNLAELYVALEKDADAEKLFTDALEINSNFFEGDHPNTATGLNNLAMIYRKQHKYKDAEPLFKQSFEMFESIFGPDHPNTKAIKDNYEGNNQDMTNAENDASQ